MEDSVLVGRARTLALVIAVALGLAAWWGAGWSDLRPPARALAGVTVVMAVFWAAQPIPIAATSLIPIALYPLLGIAGRKEVCAAYGDSNVFLYLGGFIIALGLERWNLHRRMALQVMLAVGSSPRRLVFGMAFATAFLSMWISNTATTLLMLPIALSLVQVLDEELPRLTPGLGESELAATLKPFSIALLLAVAFGATCGGLATIVGTPTNTSFRGFWNREFADKGWPALSAADWMTAFVPLAGLMLVGLCFLTTIRLANPPGADRLGRQFCRERLAELGRMSSGERRMLIVFLTTAGLWITREPLTFGDWRLLPGWDAPVTRWLTAMFSVKDTVARTMADDSTAAMLMALAMFVVRGRRQAQGEPEPLIDWDTVQRRVPWGVLLLFGGGFAMADAFSGTGLAAWLGGKMGVLFKDWPLWAIIAGCCALVTLLSEFTSNVATVNTALPVLAPLAASLKVDPRVLLIPAAVSASLGFMLPVATPPNAIVYGTGRVPVKSMMRYGLALDMLGVVLITLFGMTVIPWAFKVAN
jgi:solute carrier family 13 (sodium-dependent dicarboxylate transporter), member 2/3/5